MSRITVSNFSAAMPLLCAVVDIDDAGFARIISRDHYTGDRIYDKLAIAAAKKVHAGK